MSAGHGKLKKLVADRANIDLKQIVTALKSAPMEGSDGKEYFAHLLSVVLEKEWEGEDMPKKVAKAGAIDPLVALVSAGSSDGAQIHACACLASIGHNSEERCDAIAHAGGIAPLVGVVKSGSQKAQISAAQALASLSDDHEHQEPIIKAGAISPLVRLLRVGTADAQVQSALALANLTSGNTAAQNDVASAGAISMLLPMLAAGSAQMSAAKALAKLAYGNRAIQDGIADEGGIPPLLALLNGVNIPAQVEAASALANLARDNEQTQALIFKAGGIGPLLALLLTRSTQAQARGAEALAQLARNNTENQDAMARMGAISPLVNLTNSNNIPDVQAMAALAITEIARLNEPNQSSAAQYGAVSFLIQQLKDKRTSADIDAVKAEAAGAVWVLSEHHPKNKISFAANQGIAPIVQLLATGNERAQEHSAYALASLGLDNEDNQSQITALLVQLLGSGSLEAKSRASAALWRLVQENPNSRDTIASAASASDLVVLLIEGTPEAKSYGLWSLSLSINADNQKTLLEENGVTPLVEVLSAQPQKPSKGWADSAAEAEAVAKAETTREQGAAAIMRLASKNNKAQVAIAKADGIEPLITILKPLTHDTERARECAAAALADLALIKMNREAICKAGGIEPVVLLLNEGKKDGKKAAAAALARLATKHAETAADISGAGAIPPLVDLLSGEHGDGAQEEGAHALYQLAENAANRQKIAAAEGIAPLVVLLGSNNTTARSHAEQALVRLSIENANRSIIIQKLVSMLHHQEGREGETSAQEQAAAALANLAKDSAENRNSIVDAGGIQPLLELLQSNSIRAKENSVDAITQLAYKSSTIQRAIADAGGIPLLANVLTSASSNVKEMAAAAKLCSLAAHAVSQLAEGNKENQIAITEAGAIQPLVAMLGSPNPELQANAALALSELSHNNVANQAAVARTGAIAPLCTLVREGADNDVKEQSAAGLWSLAADNNANKATVAKLGGIEPLVTLLVTGGSDRSWENSIGALSALSHKHVENRENIAKLLVARMGSRIAMLQTPGGATRVLSAVSKICYANTSNQLAMAKAGGVPPLIMWLGGGFDTRTFNGEAQREAAHALLALVTDNEQLQGAVVRANGIPPIIELVRAKDNKDSLDTQGYAARTLFHLSGSSESGNAIAEAGGMSPLVTMLAAEDVHAQELAAVVIARLLKANSNVSMTVAEVGGIVPLVRLLSKGSPAGQQQAASALTEVGSKPINRDIIADAGGIKALVDLLSSTVAGTPETAARAIANLARDEEVVGDDGGAPDEAEDGSGGSEKAGAKRRTMILHAGGVKHLIQMLWAVPNKAMAKKMWDLVAKVMGMSTNVDGGAGGEPPSPMARRRSSVANASGGGDGDADDAAVDEILFAPEQAAATLSDLAYGDEAMQDAIMDSQGVQPLLRLVRTGSMRAQEYAARAIWHLCAATHNQGLIVEAGAIGELVALSKTGSARAQELAAAVISDLAKGAIIEREKAEKKKMEEEAEKAAARKAAGEDVDELGIDEEAAGEGEEGETAPEAAEDDGEEKEPEAPKDRLGAIAEAGGIGPLVGLVSTGNAMGKERAASALWHLSVDAVNQVSIAKAGGIPPIVQLLDDGTTQATVYAADALARLSTNNTDNQTNIAKKLVSLLGYKNPDAQKRAAHALWQLAANNQGAPVRVVNAGAISPLVMLLGTGTLEAKEEAVGALTCLAHNDPSNQLAIATGLVALLGTGAAEGQEQVTLMLIKFAMHPENRKAISAAGAINRLIIQLKGGGETSVYAQELAAAVLVHLTDGSPENVESVAEEGGIKPLVMLLNCDNEDARARASAVVSKITYRNRDIQARVMGEGAIEPLVQLLSEGATIMGKSEAAGAIWSLSSDNAETKVTIAEAGAVVPLVELLKADSADAHCKGSGALASLSIGNQANQEAIAAAGGVQPLVHLLGDEHNDEVHAKAATALAELARDHPANQTAVAKAGGIMPFVQLLSGDGAEEAKQEAATALWSFSTRHSENQHAIAKAGALKPLVALLGYGAEGSQEQAAGALASVALNNADNQSTIASMVVALLANDDLETCAKAAKAISRLARAHPSNQVAIAAKNGIKPLVAMLRELSASRRKGGAGRAPPPSATKGAAPSAAKGGGEVPATPSKEEQGGGGGGGGGEPEYRTLGEKMEKQLQLRLQKSVASALWSMAYNNAENQTSIAQEGGVPLLIELLSGNSMVHRNAAGALWSLAADDGNQMLIFNEGGVTPLVTLLTEGNPGSQEAAAGAIHSLAALAENRVAIADAGGVPALVAIFGKSTADAKKEAAGALATLVVKNVANQNEVSKGLVEVLNSSDNEEVHDHVTRLLYNLSLDPENRGALSKWGAIPQLAGQLRDGSTKGQFELVDNAANALSQIALKSPQHRVQVTAQLIILLGSPVLEVRQRAWTALKDMAEMGGSDNQMTVAMAGGIDRFVKLLTDGSVEAQEYALWLLWQSTDTSSKVSIARASCAKPIILVFNSGKLSPVAEEHAAAVIAGITSDSVPGVPADDWARNKEEVVSSGGIKPLTRLLRTGSPGAKRHAALALAQLTRSATGAVTSTQSEIAAAGAIAALVEWLVDPTIGPPDIAARALSDIGRKNLETQQSIAEGHAIPPLVAMMAAGCASEHTEKATIAAQWAAGAIATLSEDNADNQVAIAGENALSPLVNLLRGAERGPHENATRALWYLAETPENQLDVAREGAVPPLVAMLSADTESGQEWAAAALEALSRNCAENQVALSRAGAIPPLVLLLGSESAETQRYAQGALFNVAAPNQDNRNAVVKALVALLEVRNAAAQMKAAETLAMLASRSVENRVAIAQAGAIPPLVGLLGDGRNVNKTQVRAAAALSDLARTGEHKQTIVDAGGVQPLVMMLASSNVEAQTRASGALAFLSATTSAQKLIANADGISLLVALLSSERLAAANHAGCALYNLDSTTGNKEAILKAGAIQPLVSLLKRTDDPGTQESVTALLADLAKEKSGGKGKGVKASIVKVGGIEPLIDLLQNGNEKAQKHAACAIWGLASEHQTALTKLGAVPPLVALLTSTNTEAQGYAAAALNNLANDKLVARAINEAGGAEPLQLIAQGAQSWMRTQAVGILQNMKVEAPKAQAGPPLKVVQHKPYYLTPEAIPAWEIGRGWDSTFQNPRLMKEGNEHLLYGLNRAGDGSQYSARATSPRSRSPRWSWDEEVEMRKQEAATRAAEKERAKVANTKAGALRQRKLLEERVIATSRISPPPSQRKKLLGASGVGDGSHRSMTSAAEGSTSSTTVLAMAASPRGASAPAQTSLRGADASAGMASVPEQSALGEVTATGDGGDEEDASSTTSKQDAAGGSASAGKGKKGKALKKSPRKKSATERSLELPAASPTAEGAAPGAKSPKSSPKSGGASSKKKPKAKAVEA